MWRSENKELVSESPKELGDKLASIRIFDSLFSVPTHVGDKCLSPTEEAPSRSASTGIR